MESVKKLLDSGVPAVLGLQTLARMHPSLSSFITTTTAAGYGADAIMQFIRDKFENPGKSQYRQSVERGAERGTLRPDEMGALKGYRQDDAVRKIPALVAGAVGFDVARRSHAMQADQEAQREAETKAYREQERKDTQDFRRDQMAQSFQQRSYLQERRSEDSLEKQREKQDFVSQRDEARAELKQKQKILESELAAISSAQKQARYLERDKGKSSLTKEQNLEKAYLKESEIKLKHELALVMNQQQQAGYLERDERKSGYKTDEILNKGMNAQALSAQEYEQDLALSKQSTAGKLKIDEARSGQRSLENLESASLEQENLYLKSELARLLNQDKHFNNMSRDQSREASANQLRQGRNEHEFGMENVRQKNRLDLKGHDLENKKELIDYKNYSSKIGNEYNASLSLDKRFPLLFSAVDREVKKGKDPLQAAAAIQFGKKFDREIQLISEEMPFSQYVKDFYEKVPRRKPAVSENNDEAQIINSLTDLLETLNSLKQ